MTPAPTVSIDLSAADRAVTLRALLSLRIAVKDPQFPPLFRLIHRLQEIETSLQRPPTAKPQEPKP